MQIRLLVLTLTTLLPAAIQATTDQRGGHHRQHHDFPQPVHAFHDVMAPIWHGPGGAERSSAICREVGKMQDLARAVVEAPPPEGVDAGGWRQSADMLLAQTVAIGDKCTSGEPGDLNRAFADLHHAFHGLVKHVGHSH